MFNLFVYSEMIVFKRSVRQAEEGIKCLHGQNYFQCSDVLALLSLGTTRMQQNTLYIIKYVLRRDFIVNENKTAHRKFSHFTVKLK